MRVPATEAGDRERRGVFEIVMSLLFLASGLCVLGALGLPVVMRLRRGGRSG
ncbi:hypothetical protein [Phenylobacterium sp. J367]|uniref:hypothetical protein n=1 Tax=Phenylobacterium sp. J367 TaxID=2898435 RepID=UPI002151D8EA|nr:hypothetical protein [Phenylobacterium sp. J367]MCR5879809.1 hypothetical protein [Phenylobacterium sp. J367]